MTAVQKQTLYTDSERQWYFLVPDDESLPEGDFTIFTLIGRPAQVDPNALVPYEISRDNAEGWIKAQLSQVVEQAADSIKGFLNSLYTRGKPDKASDSSIPSVEKRWGIEVIADLMGESITELQTDAQARARGWKRLFADATVIFQAAKTGDQGHLSLAQARLNEIIRVLQSHDIPVSQIPDDSLQQLHDLYSTGDINTPPETPAH